TRRRSALASPREPGGDLLSVRLRRSVRRAAIASAVFLTLLVAGLWLASQTGVVQQVVRARPLDLLREHLDGDVELGHVDGTLGHSMPVSDLRLVLDGRTLVGRPRIDVTYAPLAPLSGRRRP